MTCRLTRNPAPIYRGHTEHIPPPANDTHAQHGWRARLRRASELIVAATTIALLTWIVLLAFVFAVLRDPEIEKAVMAGMGF